MFSRIKGVIDSQIAAEQTRVKSGQNRVTSSSPSARRYESRSNPAVFTLNQPKDEKEIDPVELEDDGDSNTPDFRSIHKSLGIECIPDDGTSPVEGGKSATTAEKGEIEELQKNGKQNGSSKSIHEAARSSNDLPADVRTKLRKLEKIERKYADLLRSYKIVHARNALIEPFEKALRENTPCGSISDPKSLIDYINSFSVRADLAKEEMIRVAQERDEQKAQANQAKIEVESKDKIIAGMVMDVKHVKNHPLQKTAQSSNEQETAADIFNYDDEQTNLETKVECLEEELDSIRNQLEISNEERNVAEETMQSMQKSVEDSQMKLEDVKESGLLRDIEIELLRGKTDDLNGTLSRLHSKVDRFTKKYTKGQTVIQRKFDVTANECAQLHLIARQLEERKFQLGEKIMQLHEVQTSTDGLRKEIKCKEEENFKMQEKLELSSKKIFQLETSLEESDKSRRIYYELQRKVAQLERQLLEKGEFHKSASAKLLGGSGDTVASASTPIAGGAGRKRNKRKKKAKAINESATLEDNLVKESQNITEDVADLHLDPSATSSESIIAGLQNEIEQLKKKERDREAYMLQFQSKAADTEELTEEIESLRENLISIGQDYVEAKDKLKVQARELIEISLRKEELEFKVQSLELEIFDIKDQDKSKALFDGNAVKSFVAEMEEMKRRCSTLKTDLFAAEKLAAARFKEQSELREYVEKTQLELASLREKNASLVTAKNHLDTQLAKLKRLERLEQDFKNDLKNFNKKISDKENEISSYKKRLAEEISKNLRFDEQYQILQNDLFKARKDNIDVSKTLEQTEMDLKCSNEELSELKPLIAKLNQDTKLMQTEKDDLIEDLQLKSAQIASTQSLMNSLREQTNELRIQTHEALDQRDSAEEEIVEAQRLLIERTREAETMRRLLHDMEARYETRMREMKERVDITTDERDKAEEEAAKLARRRAQELETAKDRLRQSETQAMKSEQALKAVQSETFELRETKQHLQGTLDREKQAFEEMKRTIETLTSTIQYTDNQLQDFERQQRSFKIRADEAEARFDDLQKQYQAFQDENRYNQEFRVKGQNSNGRGDSVHSVKSTDMNRFGTRIFSTNLGTSQVGRSVDIVYLKNVLIQFMELKDKTQQRQLIPALKMLLDLDKAEEQKWQNVITR